MNNIQKFTLKLKFTWMIFKMKLRKQKNEVNTSEPFIYEQDD
jgi:hypothetical protein